jgi:hypothetical protein
VGCRCDPCKGLRGAFGLADTETESQLFITLFDSRDD